MINLQPRRKGGACLLLPAAALVVSLEHTLAIATPGAAVAIIGRPTYKLLHQQDQILAGLLVVTMVGSEAVWDAALTSRSDRCM